MSTPAMIYLALIMISLGISLENHGKPKKGTNSFAVSFIAAMMALSLLYWGDFFNKVAS